MEKHKASPEMQKFFEKLLIVKSMLHSFSKDMKTMTKTGEQVHKNNINTIEEIYSKLDEIIKKG